MRKIIDISPPISNKTAVFPGDTPFSRSIQLDFKKGDNLLLSKFETSCHIGAHTDAPNHYHASGNGIHAQKLETYMGPAQVVTVTIPRGERIRIEHLKNIEIIAPRVLFRTLSFPNPNQWNSDFNSLSAEIVDFLAKKKVILVGIDTPSIDPEQDKILESHQAVFKNKLAILEGIVLEHVHEGLYELIALPLPIVDGDASPIRAVLVKNS